MYNSTNMNLPKVSIIIPVYNGADYLAETIECALNQTYENTEVIVVNDGSNDDGKTEEIAKSYGDAIRYFYKENGGVSTALNYGIKNMTGEYFSWLSHDDLYTVSKIENSITLLGKKNLIDRKTVAFTSGRFIDTDGNKMHKFRKYFDDNKVYLGKEVVNIMTIKGTLNGCCMLIPREAFDKVGLFNEELRYSQDSLMWYQIFLKGFKLVSDNNENVMYRLHKNQTSQTRKDLYEHDALYIVRTVVDDLFAVDNTGKIVYQYAKRLSKYKCEQALNYIQSYDKKKHIFNIKQRLAFKIWIFLGRIRYIIAKIYKDYLIKKNER